MSEFSLRDWFLLFLGAIARLVGELPLLLVAFVDNLSGLVWGILIGLNFVFVHTGIDYWYLFDVGFGVIFWHFARWVGLWFLVTYIVEKVRKNYD